MTVLLGPRPGESVFEFARRLCDEAKRRGTNVIGEFNESPISATPAATSDDVVGRWYKERLDAQQSDFTTRVSAIADTLRGKKIANVMGRFTADGPDELTLVFEDGTSFGCLERRY